MPVNWHDACTCTLQAYPDLLPWYNIRIVLQFVNVDISLLFLPIFIPYKAEIDKLLMRYTNAPFQVYL